MLYERLVHQNHTTRRYLANDQSVKIGDQATGTKVLMPLYNQMKNKPVATDLNAIWKRLGVSFQGTRIIF